MTEKKITKILLAKGISLDHLEISRDEVEVVIPSGLTDGRCDYDKSLQKAREVAAAIGFNSIRSRGYGGWGVFKEGLDMGDYTDPSSKWHY